MPSEAALVADSKRRDASAKSKGSVEDSRDVASFKTRLIMTEELAVAMSLLCVAGIALQWSYYCRLSFQKLFEYLQDMYESDHSFVVFRFS